MISLGQLSFAYSSSYILLTCRSAEGGPDSVIERKALHNISVLAVLFLVVRHPSLGILNLGFITFPYDILMSASCERTFKLVTCGEGRSVIYDHCIGQVYNQFRAR